MIERIVSQGLDAPAKFAPTLKVRKAMHGTEEASKGGKVRVRIIHGLTLVIIHGLALCMPLGG